MVNQNEKKPKIILILMPPILNYFDWKKSESNYFLSSSEIVKDKKQKVLNWKKENLFVFAKSLLKSVSNSQIAEILKTNSKKEKIVFLNYPLTKEDHQTFQEGLKIADQRDHNYLFVSFNESGYREILKYKNEMIICPVCEKSWEKKRNLHDGNFFCPADEITFSQKEVEIFTEDSLNNYFEKSKEVANEIGKNNNVFNLTLKLKEDFEPNNLSNYLLEKINKI